MLNMVQSEYFAPFIGIDKAFLCCFVRLASSGTKQWCEGVADKKTWLKAKEKQYTH
jgi:hypothetical protein